jgi:hypothetical protein
MYVGLLRERERANTREGRGGDERRCVSSSDGGRRTRTRVLECMSCGGGAICMCAVVWREGEGQARLGPAIEAGPACRRALSAKGWDYVLVYNDENARMPSGWARKKFSAALYSPSS